MVELAQLCTAPHLEFLISSLDWVSRAPRRPLAFRHPHLGCALRRTHGAMAAKEVLPLPRRRGFVKMCLRH
jgi:hypothetical protein